MVVVGRRESVRGVSRSEADAGETALITQKKEKKSERTVGWVCV